MTRLKMKDLERATGVGRESIRFYIREGLLPEPERPGRNVAWYDESFVERIRLIKELQQKRYLPLQVIKAIVRGDLPPSAAETATLHTLDGRLRPAVDEGSGESLAAVALRTGVSATEIRELRDHEAIAIGRHNGLDWLKGENIRLVELWGRLRAAGFTKEHGFGTEQVRLYVDVVRVLARDELRRFTEGLADRVSDEEIVRMAEEGIRIGSEVIALLRHATLLRFVADGAAGSRAPGSAKPSRARARARRAGRRA
jgi:DNA-binding transcriptional MerR regulator